MCIRDRSKSDAGKAIDGVIGAITGALKSGGDVRIVGFGTFSVAHRKATTGRILELVNLFKLKLLKCRNLNLELHLRKP